LAIKTIERDNKDEIEICPDGRRLPANCNIDCFLRQGNIIFGTGAAAGAGKKMRKKNILSIHFCMKFSWA
jgi:hypothetical protein